MNDLKSTFDKYVKRIAAQYNSGIIAAESFKDCWSNSYGSAAVFDPKNPDNSVTGFYNFNNKFLPLNRFLMSENISKTLKRLLAIQRRY